jgi:hypothetical protein
MRPDAAPAPRALGNGTERAIFEDLLNRDSPKQLGLLISEFANDLQASLLGVTVHCSPARQEFNKRSAELETRSSQCAPLSSRLEILRRIRGQHETRPPFASDGRMTMHVASRAKLEKRWGTKVIVSPAKASGPMWLGVGLADAQAVST